MKRVRKSLFLAVALGLSVLCGTTLADVIGLEIIGPEEVAENFRTSYKAIAYYDNNGATSTMDVTNLALWMVEPNTVASIEAGMLTTKDIVKDQKATIWAGYTEGDVTVDAEKVIDVFAICPSGYALEFDGGNDYVNCGNNSSLNITDAITVSAWIYPKHNRWAGILSKGDDVVKHDDYGLWFNNGKVEFSFNWPERWTVYPSGDRFIGNRSVQLNYWSHFAGTWDGNKVKLYINGVLDTQFDWTYGINSSNAGLYIGLNPGGLDEYFNGTIDEVSIYNRALSAEEIRATMHTRLNGDEPGLVGYWDFDEGEGQIVYDLSGNGNDGQLGATTDVDDSDPAWIESDAPIGICTPYLSATMAAERVIERKIALIEELMAALAQEWAIYEVLEDMLESGDYGDLYKGDIVTAKQKIHSATQHEQQAIDALQKSIEKLEDSLSSLGYEPASSEPNQPTPPPPPPSP